MTIQPINILDNGTAERMGGGVFVLKQKDERGRPHSVVVTQKDMEELLAAC